MAYTPPVGGSAGLEFIDGYSAPSSGDINLEFGSVSAAIRQAGGFSSGIFGVVGVKNAARFLRFSGPAFTALGRPTIARAGFTIRPVAIEPPSNAVSAPQYVRWRQFLTPQGIDALESFYSVARVRLVGGYNPPPGSGAVLNWLGEPYAAPNGGVVTLEFGALGSGRVNSATMGLQQAFGLALVRQPVGIRPGSASTGAAFGTPSLQTAVRSVLLSGYGIAASAIGTPHLANTAAALRPGGINEWTFGSPVVFNWRTYVSVPGFQGPAWGIPYVQGGVKTVVVSGLASLATGAVTVVNTRADQTARPGSIAPPAFPQPLVSPRFIRPTGILGTTLGTARVQFPPQPHGWLSSAYGYPTVEYKTKTVHPAGIAGYGEGFPRVADRARKLFHAASPVTAVFGDVQVQAKNFRITVPGLLSQEISPWAEVRNTRRFLLAAGMSAPGVGTGTTALNKTPSIAPAGISSLQFGRVDHMVVGWRVRTVSPTGVPVPFIQLGTPVLWQTPSFTPQGITPPPVPGPMVTAGVRFVLQLGAETLRMGQPAVGFAYRAILAEERGIDGTVWGVARVEHEHRTIDLLSSGFMAFGTAWVERGLRAIAPVSIREPDMHLHQIAGTRYLGAEGFEATRWLTRIIPESREIFPKTFGAAYGLAAVQHRKRFLRPLGVTTYPEAVQHWGTARVWNLRQVVTMYDDQSSGLWPLPWPQWTAIENRNRTPRVTGFNAGRVASPTVANKARTLAPSGVPYPVLPEYQKTGMVSHRLRPLPLDGIDPPPMTRWAIVHNAARPLLPMGFAATVLGQTTVVNLRRFYKLQGFDSAWFGYPFVAPRIRELTFESRYGIQPPRIELPVVQLYARYIEPKSIDQSGIGAVELRIFFRKITPRWTLRDYFGEPSLRNKTPEVRTRGRAADEWGDARVRLQWRPVKTEGTNMEQFGLTKIADRKQRLSVPGANYMLVSDKVTVRRIGALPVVTQHIDLRIFVNTPDGMQVEGATGHGIPSPLPSMGKPDLLKGYIFHGSPPGHENDMLLMGRPTITANTIRVEPGIFDFYVGEPFVSLKNRVVSVPTMGQLVVDSSDGARLGSWGKPAISPHTIYAVLEASEQAIRNHNMGGRQLVRSFEEFGHPSVFTWVGIVAPQGIGPSGALGSVGATWGVGHPVLFNKLQHIRPVGSLMQRLGWPTIPGTQTILLEESITGHATGTPSVGHPPYVGPSYIRAGAISFLEFGRAMVDHRHRVVRPLGLFAQAMGTSTPPNGNGTLYMPQALHVGPKRPTIPTGYDAALYGLPWVSLRVRELQPQGHDSFLSEYDLQNFAKRMRVRNLNDAWGGRRPVFAQGHQSSRVGAPGVRPGTHYIRPDGNADQYRKGAF